jgi:hypothetical protein
MEIWDAPLVNKNKPSVGRAERTRLSPPAPALSRAEMLGSGSGVTAGPQGQGDLITLRNHRTRRVLSSNTMQQNRPR